VCPHLNLASVILAGSLPRPVVAIGEYFGEIASQDHIFNPVRGLDHHRIILSDKLMRDFSIS